MATFSQLPNEMITGIWECVLEPRDVESFALVSKRIYAIGAPFMDEHNKLKRKYSFWYTVLHQGFLKKILQWPRVALYITNLSIGRYCGWRGPCNDDMKFFIEMIRRADLVPPNEVEDWITAVKEGSEDAIMALLLLILPNLCTMTLRVHSHFDRHFTQTFKRISETKNSPFLTRLTSVNVKNHLTFVNQVTNWEILSISTTLPSVQSIHVARIAPIDIRGLIKRTRCFKPGSSTIKELAFAESSICPKSMFQLFKSIKGLKKFTYSDPDERAQPFEPFWMGEALVAYGKHSLEFLKITAEQTKGVGTLGSFRRCTKLRELETEVHLLVEKDRLHTFAVLLPGSIEKVHLYTGNYSRCDSVLRIIEAFERAKSQLLPNVRVLTLSLKPGVRLSQEDKELIKTSEKECWDLGIELLVMHRENNRKVTALVPAP